MHGMYPNSIAFFVALIIACLNLCLALLFAMHAACFSGLRNLYSLLDFVARSRLDASHSRDFSAWHEEQIFFLVAAPSDFLM